MGLISNITHSIAHALGLSRSSRSHAASKPQGPVGKFKGTPVQALSVQSWHQSSARSSGQALTTQLHQRSVHLVPPNSTLNTGSFLVANLTGEKASALLQNAFSQPSNTYHVPPNSTLHLGGTSVTNYSVPQPPAPPPRSSAGDLPPTPVSTPPRDEGADKPGDTPTSVASSKSTTPAESPEAPELAEPPSMNQDELREALFPCCQQLEDIDEQVNTLTKKGRALY